MDIDVSGDARLVEGWSGAGVFCVSLIGYVALGRLAATWVVDPGDLQPFWPATGAVVGIAMLVRPQRRPLVIAGGIAGLVLNEVAFVGSSAADTIGEVVVVVTQMAVAVVGFGNVFRAENRVSFGAGTVLGVVGSLAVGAVGSGIAVLWFDPSDPWAAFVRRALGDGLGLVAVGGVLLLLREPRNWASDVARRGSNVERMAVVAATAGVGLMAAISEAQVGYLVVIAVLWSAVRFGPGMALPLGLAVVVGGCAAAASGVDPLDAADGTVLARLHAFNWSVVLSAVIVGRYVRSVDLESLKSSALLELLPDSVAVVNRHGTVVDQVVEAETPTPEHSAALATGAALQRQRALEGEGLVADVVRLDEPRPEYFELRMTRLDSDHVLSVARNVTAAAEAAGELRRATRNWQRLASTAYEGFAEFDAQWNVRYVSARWAEMMGAESADQLRGLAFADLLGPDDFRRFVPHTERTIRGSRVTFEEQYHRLDGRVIWVLITAEPWLDEHGKFAGAVVFAADTTAVHHERSQRVAAELRLATTEERERERISRALHDGPLQSMVALSIRLSTLSSSEDSTAAGLEQIALDAVQSMRGTLEDLVPPDVSRGGLRSALLAVAERIGGEDRPEVVVDDQTSPPLPAPVASTLFRVGREAIGNALLHAQASRIDVTIKEECGSFTLDVIDDGIGFRDEGRAEGHLGTTVMRDRSHEVGGRCTISSGASGTHVAVQLPADASEGSQLEEVDPR